jgi:hypothetical protein
MYVSIGNNSAIVFPDMSVEEIRYVVAVLYRLNRRGYNISS